MQVLSPVGSGFQSPILLVIFLLAGLGSAAAQQPWNKISIETDGPMQPDKMAAVKGAPYSADAVMEISRIGPDGQLVVHRTTSKLYRDSAGRERCEESSAGGSYTAIVIFDPVEHASYLLDPATREAIRSVGRPLNVAWEIHGSTVRYAPDPLMERPIARRDSHPIGRISAEQLGPRMYEGIVLVGTRNTVKAIDSDIQQPRTSVEERWVSPDLHIAAIVSSTDQFGWNISYKLSNIIRGEQPRALFKVPGDYRVRSAYAVKMQEIKAGPR